MDVSILPYSYIVAQERLRLALELAYISPNIGGVLATGQRGTAKSTTVRAFARMASGRLPVTLPIGATDDRVLGGWQVDALMRSDAVWQPGLIEEAGTADRPGMLYIDEVNLLDDHLVNIILDVASTGILTVQRDGSKREAIPVRFSLVGTMNPEEGSLRPQLLDRFGLVVAVASVQDPADRSEILRRVLRFEAESGQEEDSEYIRRGYALDDARRAELAEAGARLAKYEVTPALAGLAAAIAGEFEVEGHRGELVMVRAARALAARNDAPRIEPGHLAEVAPLALMHRRATGESGTLREWSAEDDERLGRHAPTAGGV